MSRKRAAIAGIAGVGLIGGAGLAAVGLGGGGSAPPAYSSVPPATAAIERTTLVETQKVDGVLGYGTTRTAAGGSARGTITWLAAPGAVISRGGSAYKLDNRAVPLLYGSIPLYRTLKAGTEGDDVRQFEENLRALGYTGFTVDDTYSSDTAAAVKRWQDDHELPETGKVAPGSVLVAPGQIRVAERKAHVGDKPDRAVLTYTGTTRVVTVDLSVEYQRLAREGAQAKISLPGGGSTRGTIAKIGKVAKQGKGDDDPTTIKITIAVGSARSIGSYDKAPVEVQFTARRHTGVLAVPIAALLAQPNGGYSVQVVNGGSVRTIPVETGVFSKGKVEISGSGLSEGMKVGIPT